MTHNEVNHPKHYSHIKINGKDVEVIDLIKGVLDSGNYTASEGADLFNALKYILRYPYKGHPSTDIDKAIWYLQDLKKVVFKNGEAEAKQKPSQRKSYKMDDVESDMDNVKDTITNQLNKALKELTSKKKSGEPLDNLFDSLLDKANLSGWLDTSSTTDETTVEPENNSFGKVTISIDPNELEDDDSDNTFLQNRFAEVDKDELYFSTVPELDKSDIENSLSKFYDTEAEDGNACVVLSNEFDGYLKLKFKLKDVINDHPVAVTLHVFYEGDQVKNHFNTVVNLVFKAFKNSVPEEYEHFIEEDKANYKMDISDAIHSARSEQ